MESDPAMISKIQSVIDASEYKTWQAYLLLGTALMSAGLYFDVLFVERIVQTVEMTLSAGEWVVILGLQGILIAFWSEVVYEQNDQYGKAMSYQFGSKDRLLLTRVGLMTAVSGIITMVVPEFLADFTKYTALQSLGAVIVLGIFLVHTGSSNWNPRTEWPAILAGILLSVVPSL